MSDYNIFIPVKVGISSNIDLVFAHRMSFGGQRDYNFTDTAPECRLQINYLFISNFSI